MPTSNLIQYNRAAAVAYAHKWALGRNPDFYDYEELGGDCTNFASQCLYAGASVMNFTPVFGWYYINANQKAPAWTGVTYFYNFLTRKEESPGSIGVDIPPSDLEPGDFIQFRQKNKVYGHTPIIVAVGTPPTPANILVAAHSYNTDNRPLSTYFYQEIRYIHILGTRPKN